MARSLGSRLSPELLEQLAGGRLFRAGGLALPFLTVDEAGWPHVAMLPGAVAVRPDVLWLAVGARTGSLQNAERQGRATVLLAGPGLLYYVKGRPTVVRRQMVSLAEEAAVRLDVTEVLADHQPFLEITGGIGYRYRLAHEEALKVLGAILNELAELAEAN